MSIKPPVRYYYTPIKMGEVKKTYETKCWWGCGPTGALPRCQRECKIPPPFWKTVQWCPTQLNTHPACDSVIPLLDIYPGEMKTQRLTNECSKKLYSKSLRERTEMLAAEWITDYGEISTSHSAIKRNEILIHATWMNLKNIILSKRG